MPGGVRTRAVDRLASPTTPRTICSSRRRWSPRPVPSSSAELLRVAARQGTPLTFRSGGTSLSGQAVTDGVLVDTRRHFREIEVLDGGARVRVQPGATVRQVNARLAPYRRKLGPDPASESPAPSAASSPTTPAAWPAARSYNTYRTLESLVLVLPSGTVIDTGAPDADERLRALEPALHEGLGGCGTAVRGEPGVGPHHRAAVRA